jgi:hypothetical protein
METVQYNPLAPVLDQLKPRRDEYGMQPFVFEHINYAVSVQVGWYKHCSFINENGYELSGPEWDLTFTDRPDSAFPVHRCTSCEISVFRTDIEPVPCGGSLNVMLARFEAVDAGVRSKLMEVLTDPLEQERILSRWQHGGISFTTARDCTTLLNAFHLNNQDQMKPQE